MKNNNSFELTNKLIVLAIVLGVIIWGSYKLYHIFKLKPDENRYEMTGISLNIYGLDPNKLECKSLSEYKGQNPVLEISFNFNYVSDSTKWGNIGYRMEGVDGAIDTIQEFNLIHNGIYILNNLLTPISSDFRFQLEKNTEVKSGTVINQNCYESLRVSSLEIFKEKYNNKSIDLLSKDDIERILLFELKNEEIMRNDTIILEAILNSNKIIRDTLVIK